jgi:hypothetical protein
MRTLQTVGAVLVLLAAAYVGWRALLFGAWLRQKVHGEPEPSISLFKGKTGSK